MSIVEFIQLVLRNKKWVLIFPLLVAVLVFLLTRNSPNTYTSEMVIYTGIASGYSIDNNGAGKVDYHQTNSRFDNLINTISSRETHKELSLQLLSYYITNPEALNSIKQDLTLDDEFWIYDEKLVSQVRSTTLIETYTILSECLDGTSDHFVYQTLYGKPNNPFNLRTLSSIQADRIGFSDMVKVQYTAENGQLTKKTLDLLADVFLNKYKGMRAGEVNNVVNYFQKETASALERLEKAELGLKTFRTQNKVINYYEQTKYIADQKEDYEQRESKLQMQFAGNRSAIDRIESKLNSRSIIQIKSDEIVKYRNLLSQQYGALSQENGLQAGQDRIEDLRSTLRNKIEDLYSLNNSKEGIPGKNMLDEWLDLTIDQEQTISQLNVLRSYKEDFEKLYDRFAPMGSELNKLERDVDVAEKEYLNLLHNLNQAKLRERNLLLTEDISIIDPPTFPLVANSSKRFLLVLASLISLVLFSILGLVIKEYLDDSIRNPIRLMELTGLETASAFATESKSEYWFEKAEEKSHEHLYWSIKNAPTKSSEKFSRALIIPFTKNNNRLQEILDVQLSTLNTINSPWEYIDKPGNSREDSNSLSLSDSFHTNRMSEDILDQHSSLFLVFDASQKLDRYLLDEINVWKSHGIPTKAIIINTKIHQLENFLGELPKKRSRLRKMVKNTIKRYSK